MATKIKVIDNDNLTYKCDKCVKTFKAEEFKLEKKADNISMCMIVMIVDKIGKPGSCYYDKVKKTDRLLACPHCGRTHLNGFDSVK